MSRRTERINELIREELSDLIMRELRDPRLENGLISITHVEVSPDLISTVTDGIVAEVTAWQSAPSNGCILRRAPRQDSRRSHGPQ